MPEYLSPGVYVEEIDLGIRPIEGVSTSTGGMVGVTERGPVNVPLLVTSFAQFQRLFGGYLDFDDYGDAAFLPQAVEGFFLNGGQRLYVTRVVADALPVATSAEATLFDRGETAGFADTRLLRHAREGDTALLAERVGGLADGDALRLDDGARAEYGAIAAGGATISAADRVLALAGPLHRGYAGGAAVEELTLTAPGVDPFAGQLDGDHGAGATTLVLDSIGPGVVVGSLLEIDAGADREVVAVASVPTLPAGPRVTLAYPLARAHADTAAVTLVVPDPPAGGATALSGTSAAGDGLLLVDATTNFLAGDVVQITDASDPGRVEFQVLAALHPMGLRFPAAANHPVGEPVTAVSFAPTANPDDLAATLDAPARAGDRVILLAATPDIGHLTPGHYLRIGPVGLTAEFHRVAARDGLLVTLGQGLALERPAGEAVEKVDRTTAADTHLIQDAGQGETTVFLATNGAGFAAADVIEIGAEGSAVVEYQTLEAPSLGILELDDPLAADHRRASLVGRRNPELRVQALDPGGWGNELRVTAQDDSLLSTGVTALTLPGQPIPLSSVQSIEVGTILDLQGQGLAKVTDVSGNEVTLVPAFGAAAGSRVVTREFQLRVEWMKNGRVLGDRTEVLRHLSLDPRHSRYVGTIAGRIDGPLRAWDRRPEGQSDFLRVEDLATPAQAETLLRVGPDLLFDAGLGGRPRAAGRFLAGGANPVAGITPATYVGQDNVDPDLRTGLQTLRNENRISIVAIPGRTEQEIQEALIGHCELQRYRFAILDSLPGGDRVRGAALSEVQDQRNLYDSRYAALYYPWLVVRDPFPDDPQKPGDLQLPPAGHMMGIYARTDVQRGVHKAPANEVIRGIRSLQRKLNKAEHDILNPSPTNICVLRDFREEGRGLRVWGARCITSDTDWKYINVRRLFLFLEQSLDEGTQWVVFEPNDEPLWARVRQSIGAFLTRVWRDGALQGATAEEAFFVKCDRTTMTQDDIDNGRLIVLVGVAPVKPAEFVIIRIFQRTQDEASQ